MKHARTVLSEDTEADMGIGTLYVLIATVLVATVAAGVLLSVAQSAQNQALDTTGLALTTVASGLMVEEIRGDRSVDGAGGTTQETIEFLELTVTLVPGSPIIAMENVIIMIKDDDTERVLRFDASASGADAHEWTDHNQAHSDAMKAAAAEQTYTAEELRDPLNTFYYDGTDTDNPDFAISKGGLIRIFIDLDDNGLELSPQETMVITILPKHGAPTDIWFETPEVYTERFVELVD